MSKDHDSRIGGGINSLIPTNGSTSPFDAIRRVTPEGREYWSARDLMPPLGYEKWERFAEAVHRAIAALTAQGADVEANVSRLREPIAKTTREDFHLSRFAAYQVAMCGDPRKPEVAAALAYFAIRTREAETSVADMVPKSLPEALRAYAREVEAREAAEQYARELEPKAEYVDQFVSPDDCVLFRVVANQLTDVAGEKALRELLVEKRWIYKVHIGRRYSKKAGHLVDEYEWRAYADKSQYFRLIPQHNAPRHHNNQVRQTLYFTPPGVTAVRRLVGEVVDA